jgi:hypothetical protein
MWLGLAKYNEASYSLSRLGGVMVSVLAIGPKFTGPNPAERMDF